MVATLLIGASFALVAGCAGGGTIAPAVPQAGDATVAAHGKTGSMLTDAQSVAATLAAQQRSDGAIAYTSSLVSPYFANLAAIGAAHVGNVINVRAYLQWYIRRSHDRNPWNIPGAITDYTIGADGSLTSTGNADSVDSYAATFLTLAATAWRHGDATLRAYVQSARGDIERIAGAIDAVTDGDGLTWALPTYRMKYLMDASEVFAGLNDVAILRAEAFGDAAGAANAAGRASALRTTILAAFWNPSRGTFATAIADDGTATLPSSSWSDATAQLWPILFGAVDPASTVAQTVYARFNAAYPAWSSLDVPDEYPWASVAVVALQMNDPLRAAAYRSAADHRFAPAFAYPWYCAESGWYLRMLAAIDAPATVAQL